MRLRLRVFASLTLPPASWFLFEQGVSALLHADCRRSGIAVLWGLASLLSCMLAVRIAWPLRHPRGVLAEPWLARLTLLLGVIFGLAITFQTIAIILVPSCLR